MRALSPFWLFLVHAAFLHAAESQPVSLAVSDLTAQGVKENEAAVVSEQLRAELMKSPHVRLIERGQMNQILKEQGFQQSGCATNECAVEVGQLLGAQNMVVGSIGMAGSYTVLSVRALDVRTGQVLVNESIRTKGGIDRVLETGVNDAAVRLCKGLFPESAPQPNAQAPAKGNAGLRNGLLIGGGVAVLAGGGVAAAVLLKKRQPVDESPGPNTRINLP